MGSRVRSWAVAFVPERSRLFVGGRDVDEVWWWWAVGGWWWWLLLVAVAWWRGRVVGCRKRRRRTTTDVVVRRLVATSYLVGVKKEAVRVLVPAYLGWARPRHRPRLPSTGCACWGLVTWRSSVVLVVVVGDDGRRVSSCRRVAVCRQRPRCVAGASLFWMVEGWVASSMVVVGRKKRRGNV